VWRFNVRNQVVVGKEETQVICRGVFFTFNSISIEIWMYYPADGGQYTSQLLTGMRGIRKMISQNSQMSACSTEDYWSTRCADGSCMAKSCMWWLITLVCSSLPMIIYWRKLISVVWIFFFIQRWFNHEIKGHQWYNRISSVLFGFVATFYYYPQNPDYIHVLFRSTRALINMSRVHDHKIFQHNIFSWLMRGIWSSKVVLICTLWLVFMISIYYENIQADI
jgi:hypothetical protein